MSIVLVPLLGVGSDAVCDVVPVLLAETTGAWLSVTVAVLDGAGAESDIALELKVVVLVVLVAAAGAAVVAVTVLPFVPIVVAAKAGATGIAARAAATAREMFLRMEASIPNSIKSWMEAPANRCRPP
ncbi:MAG: hypothetical protein ACM3X5_00925 [Bacillota bacterium]